MTGRQMPVAGTEAPLRVWRYGWFRWFGLVAGAAAVVFFSLVMLFGLVGAIVEPDKGNYIALALGGIALVAMGIWVIVSVFRMRVAAYRDRVVVDTPLKTLTIGWDEVERVDGPRLDQLGGSRNWVHLRCRDGRVIPLKGIMVGPIRQFAGDDADPHTRYLRDVHVAWLNGMAPPPAK